MRILLAEDDPHISVITQLCLEKIGAHEVVICEDGALAVEAARDAQAARPFDLILLDGMMPKKSGLQVAEELRAFGCTSPIIFLSAKAEGKAVGRFLELGVGYISKPFDPPSICARIEEILNYSSTGGERAA